MKTVNRTEPADEPERLTLSQFGRCLGSNVSFSFTVFVLVRRPVILVVLSDSRCSVA